MTRNASAHRAAFSTVVGAVSVFAAGGGVRTPHDDSAFAVLFGVFVSAVAGGVVQAVAELQAWRARPSVAGPLIWSVTLAWGASTYLLLSHPASLRSGMPVVSSMGFAALLAAPLWIYWVIHYWIVRGDFAGRVNGPRRRSRHEGRTIRRTTG